MIICFLALFCGTEHFKEYAKKPHNTTVDAIKKILRLEIKINTLTKQIHQQCLDDNPPNLLTFVLAFLVNKSEEYLRRRFNLVTFEMIQR